jgi:carbon monoxide dehydrogenase subunit G
MRFQGTLEIAAPRERVWAFLVDPARVTACAPDVERLEALDRTRFHFTTRAGVGPIRAKFAIEAEFLELREPEHATVHARGHAPGSAVEMRSTVDLSESPHGTTMRWESDVTISGLIANVGHRLIQGAADKITRDVFGCIKSTLETQ